MVVSALPPTSTYDVNRDTRFSFNKVPASEILFLNSPKDLKEASTSLLQRRFGIGYNRAARRIDVLEDHGIIGPSRGSKPREVLRKKEGESKRTETGGIRE